MGKWIENWFSNFVPNDKPFKHQGIRYLTVENFYQAMKTLDVEERKLIASVTPSRAKYLGRKLKQEGRLRSDWYSINLSVMEAALRVKFAKGTSWHTKLMESGTEEIVEWNNWGDTFFGKTLEGKGENHLGKLLMRLRSEYQQ